MSDETSASPAVLDVVVVGAGPAGLTAAIYLARSRRSTLVLERQMAGGQMAVTELIENYPGFPEGISGFDLADRMKQQAVKFGAEVREITLVHGVDTTNDRHVVRTDQGEFAGRTVLLAPGRQPRKLGVPGEAEYFGRGVSSCATCDGALYRDRTVAVVGGGDTAVEEGIFLTKFARSVHVIHRREELRCTSIAQERAFGNDKMDWVWNSVVRSIHGDEHVKAVELEDTCTGALTTLPVEGLFIFVGQIPNTDFVRDFVDLDAEGYIVTDDDLLTSRPGVFAAGDARVSPLKQISWAAGEGALAAVRIDRYLDTL